jgi:tetratricopeptide (TPR) repeat protein
LRNTGIIILLAAMLVGCQSGNSAQKVSPEQQRQYDAAFQAMLAQPGNLEVAFKYATVATQSGDLEGAVSTYEGMLMVESDLPRVRMELGVLYYRLKSYELSRTYIESALQSPTLPGDMRKPAEQLLAKMPKQSKTRRA